jgi:hypothetical protein
LTIAGHADICSGLAVEGKFYDESFLFTINSALILKKVLREINNMPQNKLGGCLPPKEVPNKIVPISRGIPFSKS